LVLRSKYPVCDEMTSMLDASTTAAPAGVVERYRRDEGAGLLAVSHDPLLSGRWCDRMIAYPG
jgi:ABC-type glutathione transport system ATPase component